MVHHPPKPRADDGKSKAGDDAYFGAGSSDLANYSRAVIAVKPTKQHGIYILRLAKRGRRVGWVEADGTTPRYDQTIAHGKGGLIYWRTTDDGEASQANTAPGKSKEDVLALVPTDKPIGKEALISRAQTNGIGLNRCRGFIAELIQASTLHEWRIRQSGTCPAKQLFRTPQPAI